MADVADVGWKSVECGGRLGDGQNGSLLTLRVNEKAGRKALLKSAGERDEGKRLAFCCLLHSGRDPGQACRRLGQPCQRPLAGMASLAAQVNRGMFSTPVPKSRALTRTLSRWEPLSRCIQPDYYLGTLCRVYELELKLELRVHLVQRPKLPYPLANLARAVALASY